MTDIVNVEQAAEWNGDSGREWVREQEHFDRAIAPYQVHLSRAAAIVPGDHVLDVGCGNGESTRTAARAATEGGVLGADISELMLEVARRKSAEEGLTNVSFVHADAQVHRFQPASVDIAISRFGVMFFGDPPAAFANIASAIRPGGRLALVVWQGLDTNDWFKTIRSSFALGRDLPSPPPGAPGPAGLADPDHLRALLAGAGFSDVQLESVSEPFWAGADVEDAFEFVKASGITRALLGGVSDDDRNAAFDILLATMQDHLGPDGVVFDSAVWAVSASR